MLIDLKENISPDLKEFYSLQNVKESKSTQIIYFRVLYHLNNFFYFVSA